MHRQIPFLACILLSGCGEPDAPTLHLTLKRDNGTSSVSIFRVFRTGRITESGDGSSDGSSVSQSVAIDKIADDGVTLTVTQSISTPAEESKKQVFIPYGKEPTIARLKDATLIGRLERKK